MVNLIDLIKNKDFIWVNVVFYFLCSVFVVSTFTYLALLLKIHIQTQRIDEFNKMMVDYESHQQKSDEKKIVDYKKKIEDFNLIIKNHKISSRVFNFIEEKTLPKVWFSNFDMSQSIGEVRLSGEAESMKLLSNQIDIFEKSQDEVKSIGVLNSTTDSDGKVRFTVSIVLHPQVYSYLQE